MAKYLGKQMLSATSQMMNHKLAVLTNVQKNINVNTFFPGTSQLSTSTHHAMKATTALRRSDCVSHSGCKEPAEECSEYNLEDCINARDSRPKICRGVPVPVCYDTEVGSEMDENYHKYDEYWPMYNPCYRHRKRLNTYQPGRDPNTNNLL